MKKLLSILFLFISIAVFGQTPKSDADLSTESTNEILNKSLNQARINSFNQNHIASKLSLFGSTLIQNLDINGAGIYSFGLGTSGSRLSTFSMEVVGATTFRSFSGNMSFRLGDNFGFFSDLRTMIIYNGSTTPNYTGTNPNVALWIKPSFSNLGSGTEFTALIQLPATSTTLLNNVTNPAEGQFAYDNDENRPFWHNGTDYVYAASMDDITGGGGSGSVNDSLRVKEESGSSYTPTQDDHNYIIYLTNAGDVTITLDNTLEPHTALHFRKDSSTGDVIFESDGTSVLTSRGSNTSDTLVTQYATCTWIKRDATEFSGIGAFGDATAGGGGAVTSIATTSPITGGTITTTGTIGINNAAADGSTKGAASFTANDFDASSGNISIDYTNGQSASGSNKGFLTSSDFTKHRTKYITLACSDLITTITTGVTKAYYDVPAAITITGVRATLLTAQSSGTILTIDINEAGNTILSTKLTIDNSETSSVTAATPYVISDSSIASGGRLTVDFDSVGTGGIGVIVEIEYYVN